MSIEGAIVGHVGACGSGKTYRLKMRVAAALRQGWPGSFVVCDVKREWPRAANDSKGGPLLVGAHIPMAKCRVPPRVRAPGEPPLLIARPPQGVSTEEIRAWCDEVCLAVLARGDTIAVIPEAYRYAREGERMAPGLETLSHEYRHHRCGIWLDFQSFPEVRKELLRRCGFIWIHGTGAHEDLERLRRTGGPALVDAVLEAQRRNNGPPEAPGHHVIFRTGNPFPPYQLRDPRGVVLATYGAAAPAVSAPVRPGPRRA